MHRVASLPPHLKSRYADWRSGAYAENSEHFRHLAEAGQEPNTMVIACCDSRVTVESLFGPGPGEIFVHRNIANLVPGYLPDGGHHGTAAAIEFAVTVLKVSHLVILGHSLCGGVQGCRQMCEGKAPHLEDKSSFVGRWIEEMRPAFADVSGIDDEADRQSAMEKAAIKVSLTNLMKYPFVAAAVDAGSLSLHGVWIEIGSGRLEGLDGTSGEFRPV